MNTNQYAVLLRRQKFPRTRIQEAARKSAILTRTRHLQEIKERGLEIGSRIVLSPEGVEDEIQSFTPWGWVKLKHKAVEVPPKDITLLANIKSPHS